MHLCTRYVVGLPDQSYFVAGCYPDQNVAYLDKYIGCAHEYETLEEARSDILDLQKVTQIVDNDDSSKVIERPTFQVFEAEFRVYVKNV